MGDSPRRPLAWWLCTSGSEPRRCSPSSITGCCQKDTKEALAMPKVQTFKYLAEGQEDFACDSLHPSCGPTGVPSASIVEQLSSLAKMKANGLLSDAEFQKAKLKLLAA